jgi:hypothetical protein
MTTAISLEYGKTFSCIRVDEQFEQGQVNLMQQNALPQLGGNPDTTYYYFETTCNRILLGFQSPRGTSGRRHIRVDMQPIARSGMAQSFNKHCAPVYG